MSSSNREYIGDGVYAEFDGYQIWLQTERDRGPERIALEPQVFNQLIGYARRVWPVKPLCFFCGQLVPQPKRNDDG